MRPWQSAGGGVIVHGLGSLPFAEPVIYPLISLVQVTLVPLLADWLARKRHPAGKESA